MRYWGLLAGKLGVSAAISYGLLALINSLWSPQIYLIKYGWKTSRFGFDLAYTLVVGVWFLVSVGLLYLCIWDQRYRCRVCLRRLRMPITTGSWGRMLRIAAEFEQRSLVAQIVDGITRLVHGGHLSPGDRLPPSRTLARELGTTRGTVVGAYEVLLSSGVLDAQPTIRSADQDGGLRLEDAADPPDRTPSARARTTRSVEDGVRTGTVGTRGACVR